MISFNNKTLSAFERRYCVTRRELLAIKSIIKFHHYLDGQKLKVRTDDSLTLLPNFKNPEVRLLDGLSFSHNMFLKFNIEPAESITMLMSCLGSVVTTTSC